MLTDVLHLWNRWGSNLLKSGIPRDNLATIIPYLHSEEIVALTGPRRSGKSTILYQLMDQLEREGIPKEAMLHLNFEEPKLSAYLTTDGLDELYSTYRTHIFPKGKCFLFLDEIQNVKAWEKWVRSRIQTEEIKVFITGSSAKLMSRELSSLLTGRHLSFEILPLSFRELLRFKEIDLPKNLSSISIAPAPIRHALETYKRWGGFPKVVLAPTDQQRMSLLSSYFDDILFKDILLRHNIRDSMLLRQLACHLLAQTGKLVSFQRTADIFNVSKDLSISYCHYIQEAYLTEFLAFYSIKSAVRQRHPQKVHALDLGLRNTVSLTETPDEGFLIETLVYQELRRRFEENVYYWKDKGEVDFVIFQKSAITHIYQVAHGHLDDEKTLQREVNAASEAMAQFPKASCFLIVQNLPKKLPKLPFEVLPLWSFLLSSK